MGWQWMPTWSGGSGELTVLTEAFYEARHRAVGRLLQEAVLLGATGVVGVRLERRAYEWGASLLEFAAIGTAIRDRRAANQAAPFVSDLSGEEFWMLRQAGFRPVGFALGNCSYYQVPNYQTRTATSGGIFGSAWQNQELTDYTQAVYNRALAMGRMEDEARAVGAVGIVGADVEVEMEPREVGSDSSHQIDILYHFTAVGTAIAPYVGRWPIFSVQNLVPLR